VQPNILEQMPLPEHLRAKLQAEFLVLARDLPSVRTALTLAAFYGGVFGEKTGSGRNVIAETQWLLKAIELGSHATLNAVWENDGLVIKALERYGGCILELRGPDFQSPEIDVQKLQSRLEEFIKMGDSEVPATVLRLLTQMPACESNVCESQDEVAEIEEAEFTTAHNSATKRRDEVLKQFTLARGFDLDPFDTGAMDLQNLRKDPLHKSAYNDDLETFIAMSKDAELTEGSKALHYYAALAASNGSVRVASYLADHFHEGPNESWEGTTHLEDAILFGHSNIARMYLQKEAELVPSNDERPSVFYYLIRHEDIELARLFCEKMKTQGGLDRILNWKPTSGLSAGNSPLRAAVSSGAWKMSKLYLELGADINLETRDRPILQSVVAPRSPHPPIELLISVLDHGADPNVIIENNHPTLQWPIFTSNVLAVQELLLHGAKPVLSEEHDFCDYAKEELLARRTQFPVNVVDEDGKVVEQNWNSAVAASELIADILSIAKDSQMGWESRIRQLVQHAPLDCLSKCWLVVGEGSNMAAIEITVPLYV
jgi:ankyrin repeat protein